MRKYEKLAEEIISNVGGKDNVNALTHCITRLRFRLKEESLAKDDVLKNMDGVITVMHGAGQYQVVIGNHVTEVYDEICKQLGIQAGDTGNEGKEPEKKGIGAFLIDFISNVMGPCINVLCASGMIKGILSILTFFGWMTQTSGIYQIINASGDALFYFFPILLGYTTAKKLKMEPFIGLVLGAGLVYPAIQNVDLDILGFQLNVNYTSTILPIIFTVVFASFVYKLLIKVVPDVIKAFFVPMVVMMVAMPIGFMFIGPVMNQVSIVLGNMITAGYNFSPVLAGFLVGGLYQIMVLFGVHGAFGAVAFIQIAAGEPSFLGFMAGTTFTQTAVVVAIWLRTKNKKLKSIAFPAIISGLFGVTEPAIYGITLPRIKFFIISCIGAGLTGAYLGLTDTLLWHLTGLGIFTIPGFIGGTAAVSKILFNVIVALAIGILFSFVLTYVLYKDEAEAETDINTKQNSVTCKTTIATPLKGDVLDLSEAEDEAFALGTLGDGVVIKPKDGNVFAPFDGTVTVLFPTFHAIGITGDSGVEILIHVGFNTVQLEGKGFVPHIKQGDHVKEGQLLLEVDLKEIEKAGFSTQTPVIISNSADMIELIKTNKKSVAKEDTLMTVLY
jgi:PTS system beta-glucosides-specific IIC component